MLARSGPTKGFNARLPNDEIGLTTDLRTTVVKIPHSNPKEPFAWHRAFDRHAPMLTFLDGSPNGSVGWKAEISAPGVVDAWAPKAVIPSRLFDHLVGLRAGYW